MVEYFSEDRTEAESFREILRILRRYRFMEDATRLFERLKMFLFPTSQETDSRYATRLHFTKDWSIVILDIWGECREERNRVY